jgi:hypothetical protein
MIQLDSQLMILVTCATAASIDMKQEFGLTTATAMTLYQMSTLVVQFALVKVTLLRIFFFPYIII